MGMIWPQYVQSLKMDKFLIPIILSFFKLLTFGVLSPQLTVVLMVESITSTSLWLLIIGRFIHYHFSDTLTTTVSEVLNVLPVEGCAVSVSKQSEQASASVGPQLSTETDDAKDRARYLLETSLSSIPTNFFSCLTPLIFLSSFLFAVFIFDMTLDTELGAGNQNLSTGALAWRSILIMCWAFPLWIGFRTDALQAIIEYLCTSASNSTNARTVRFDDEERISTIEVKLLPSA